MRRNARTSHKRTFPLVALVTVALALLGSACLPVAPLGAGPLAQPVGVLDAVSSDSAGNARVVGWAASGPIGPFSLPSGPTKIVVMLDGEWVPQSFDANLPRPDVDLAIIAAGEFDRRQPGNAYGFDFTLDVASGESTLCVVALNSDWGNFGGDHVLLGCRSVTVS